MELKTDHEIATLTLNEGKANAIGDDFLSELNRVMDQLANEETKVVIVTGYDRYFCAGLALPELMNKNRSELTVFLRSFSDSLLRFFELPMPVIAMINGHAIAGGCVLAMQADYRVMELGDKKIGLNEVALGLGLPTLVVETMRIQLQPGFMRRIAMEGDLFDCHRAHQLGLVDVLVEKGEGMGVAHKIARRLARLPSHGLGMVKKSLRGEVRTKVEQADNIDAWVDGWFGDECQAIIRAAVSRFTGISS